MCGHKRRMLVRTIIVVSMSAVVFAVMGPHLGLRARDMFAEQNAASSVDASAPDGPAAPSSDGAEVVLTRDRDSHFRADTWVNGQPLRMMIDSGATVVVMSEADARRVGIYTADQDFTNEVLTANGVVAVAPVTIDRMNIGGIERRSVRAAVMRGDALGQPLLGQSFLNTLGSVNIEGERMRLR